MTIIDQGQMLADVIQDYMGLADDRVILGDERLDAPKDSGLYVLIIYDAPQILGVNAKRDYSANTETMSVSSHERWLVEVVSAGYEAADRYMEVYEAIASSAGIRAAEDAGCAMFRGTPLNLTAVENTAPLRRYQLPVTITHVQSKTSAAVMIDKFTEPEINVEAK